jgi:hypothetical protein
VEVATAAPTETSPAFPDDWQLEFTRSGGIAGEMTRINITEEGAFIVTSESLLGNRQGTLPKEEVEEIRRLLAELHPFPAVPRGGECQDCFSYAIRLDSGGRASEVTLSESMVPLTGFGGLVAYVNSILGRELSDG